jgi:hypothetical protein
MTLGFVVSGIVALLLFISIFSLVVLVFSLAQREDAIVKPDKAKNFLFEESIKIPLFYNI